MRGLMERFHRTVRHGFFRQAFRSTLCKTVDALEADLEDWLIDYNTARSLQGYRNMERRPYDSVLLY